MPQCSYATLDYYKSDMVSASLPCLLLLAINNNNENGLFVVFVTSDIGSLLNEIPDQQRSWMLGVLFDLHDRQYKRDRIDTPEFEQFWSLGVGPLRTAAHGTIDVDNVENTDSIRDLVCTKLRKPYQEGALKDDLCFLHSFQKLRLDMLPQSDPMGSKDNLHTFSAR
jgi:hypothetical protein